MNRSIYAVATMDTKGDEVAFVAQCLRNAGVSVRTVDVGTAGPPTCSHDIDRNVLWRALEQGVPIPIPTERGQAVAAMSRCLTQFLRREYEEGRVDGVLGIGGSGGTSLITTAMRALPIGLPKLMVSTVASGDTAPYIDCNDITMMYSVVDIAGLNRISTTILANAAHAMVGMVQHVPPEIKTRPAIGLTMFGVTTPCVTRVRKQMSELGFDPIVFHATGAGGRAMEKLIESQLLVGAMDITTTEVADEVVGGVFRAGPKRFEVILESQVPYVMSLGALDMVNFGAMHTVPEVFRERRLHVHNANVTLMRTTIEENIQMGEWIARKLNMAKAPWTLLMPLGGVSALDAPGQPFYDPEADAALFMALERTIEKKAGRTILKLPYHINDDFFADAIVDAYRSLSGVAGRSPDDAAREDL